MQKLILYITILFALFSCKEDMTIDLESGEQMIGIYGSITTEKKKHTIALSKSAEFYASGDPEMISGAIVSVFDGTKTIDFEESPEYPGLYQTIDEIAGEVGLTYQLEVTIPNENGDALYFHAESKINPIPEKIDSAEILPLMFNGKIIDDYLKICPYFQTIDDSEITYMTQIAINDILVTDTLTECSIMRMRNLSGIYFNGPEMQLLYGEDNFPSGIYTLDLTKEDENIRPFDKISIYLYSIEDDYRKYMQDIANSSGSNPFMGTPSNVRSNIQPAGKAIGYFYAASMIEYSFYYANEELPLFLSDK